MSDIAELSQRLRDHGLKLTSQRLLIYRCLEHSHSHPTAEQIYDQVRGQLPTVSLTTVYKVLNELVELGEARRIDFGDGAARFDGNVTSHLHGRCSVCGAVVDLPANCVAIDVPTEACGFCVRSCHVWLDGICAACRSGGEPGVGC